MCESSSQQRRSGIATIGAKDQANCCVHPTPWSLTNNNAFYYQRGSLKRLIVHDLASDRSLTLYAGQHPPSPQPRYCNLFLRDVHLQPFLHNKEGSMRLQFPARMNELKVVVAQQSRADLVDFEEGQVAPDAEMGSTAKLGGKTGQNLGRARVSNKE